MTDPYEVMGVDRDADSEQIRRRYLQLISENPPEQHPEKFQEIRRAYEDLSLPAKRIKRELFKPRSLNSLALIRNDAYRSLRGRRFSIKTLCALAESKT